MTESSDVLVAGAARGPIQGTLRPPGDKSISHRALILAMLADGKSRIDGLLRAQDTDATAAACEKLGAKYDADHDALIVEGVGVDGLHAPAEPLDMGNSGTGMRLLAGVLAAQNFDSTLVGDASLQSRPMTRIATPLREMGAVIGTTESGCAPLRIQGGHSLRGIRYHSPVASAQIKSCLLLAGLFAEGETEVVEPAASRDHTERMLPVFGARMPTGRSVHGGARLQAAHITVPADPSSAAFFLAAAALVPQSRLTLKDVGINPTRAGLITALAAMGCDVRTCNTRSFGNEPVADLEVRWREGVRAIELGGSDIPAIIDELPVLMAMAALAQGITRIRDAAELRVKESDRIAVMAAGLEALGVAVRVRPDGIDIEGRPLAGPEKMRVAPSTPIEIDARGDHRCAMSFCVLAQALDREVIVKGAAQIDTSYPGFLTDLSAVGGRARNQEGPVNDA